MFRPLLLACSIALTAVAAAPSAEARTHHSGVSIHLGIPFYSYRVGPGWRYYDGYGWYNYRRYGDVRHHFRRNKLSCGEARRLVDRSGYDRVRVRECSGRTYTFRAVDRRGRHVTVYVNARTGGIWRG